MTDTELLQLRRAVRRDDEVTDSAARLFSEIVDLSMLKDGCTASATQLGAWLGMSGRTVRRRRDELIDAGYLEVSPTESGRALVPVQSSGQHCQSEMADKSGQTTEVADNFGQNQPDNFGQHKENKHTPESERAREEEGSESDRIDKLRSLANGDWSQAELEEADPRWRTRTYQLAHPEYDPPAIVRSEWKQKISDPSAWAKAILKGWKRGWQPHTSDAREDVYEEFRSEAEPQVYSRPDDIRSEIR